MLFEKESPTETRIREDIPNHSIHDSYDKKPLNEDRKVPNNNDKKANVVK